MCNYFRKCIPRYAELAFSITELTKGVFNTKKDSIKWTKEHQVVFENLKQKLTSPPLLRHFNPKLKINVWTDASKIGVAETLLQEDPEDKMLRPVTYVSRRITTTEQNYSAIELEL